MSSVGPKRLRKRSHAPPSAAAAALQDTHSKFAMVIRLKEVSLLS